MTPSRFRWGMILIMVGALLLMRNADIIDEYFWTNIFVYLSILLIGIGVEKIFTRTKLEFASYAASVAMVAAILWVATTRTNFSEREFFTEQEYQQEIEEGTNQLVADIQLNSGDLTVRDATDQLIYARFKELTQKPNIVYHITDGTANVEMTSDKTKLFGGMVHIDKGEVNDWYMSFSKIVPLILNCYGDYSNIHLNLSTTPLKKLKLEAHDAEIYVKLGDLEPEVEVEVLGDNSELKLRVPTSSGLQVAGPDYAEYLSQLGLEEKGQYFVTPGYDTLTHKIRIDLDERLRSFTLQPF